MKTLTIKLSMAENVKQFVSVVNAYPYEVDLRIGRHVVDAKSILGIFSLDLSKAVMLDIHSNDCADLIKALETFIVNK